MNSEVTIEIPETYTNVRITNTTTAPGENELRISVMGAFIQIDMDKGRIRSMSVCSPEGSYLTDCIGDKLVSKKPGKAKVKKS